PLLARGARDANHLRRLRRWRRGAGGARRGDRGWALRHRAAASRRTDAVAASAERWHEVRAAGRCPRDPLSVRAQRTPPPPEAALLRACFAAASRVPCGIPEHIAASVLNQIERLPPGDGLCPDLHPANGIMTADDPRLIDWTASVRASGAL